MLDLTKTYKLRDSNEYEVINPIISVGYDETAAYPITAPLRSKATGNLFWQTWTADGYYTAGYPEHTLDLVEVIEKPTWHDWPIDAKVLVRRKGRQEYIKAHYAGEIDGKPTVWILGVTSWTAEYLVGDHPIRQSAFEIKLAEEAK